MGDGKSTELRWKQRSQLPSCRVDKLQSERGDMSPSLEAFAYFSSALVSLFTEVNQIRQLLVKQIISVAKLPGFVD